MVRRFVCVVFGTVVKVEAISDCVLIFVVIGVENVVVFLNGFFVVVATKLTGEGVVNVVSGNE